MWRSLVCLGLLLVPSLAAAHGSYPRGYAVVFHPTDPNVFAMPSTVGFFLTRDGGQTWEWSCLQAQPGGTIGALAPTVIVEDGTMLVGIGDGLELAPNLACGWGSAPAPLDRAFMVDVQPVPGTTDGAYALTGDSRDPNFVYESRDNGVTWTPLPGELPTGFLTERVRVSPSDAMRFYVTGGYPASATMARRAMLFRSEDRGASWDDIPFPIEANELHFFALEVDEADPDHFFAYVRGEAHDRLVVTTNGGDTFDDVVSLQADAMPIGRTFGFALGAGDTFYYGNSKSGLHMMQDGEPTAIDKDLPISCLKIHDGYLWACADGFVAPFTLGRAPIADDGTLGAFEPVFRWSDYGIVRACGGGEVTEICACWDDDLQRDLQQGDGGVTGATGCADASVPSDATPDGGVDAALDGASTGEPGGGGCDCAVGPRRVDGSWALIVLAISLGIRRRAGARRSGCKASRTLP